MSKALPVAVFDVDGTIFKSSLLEKVAAQCIEVGLFSASDFEEVSQLRRQWQLHNTEENYMIYITTLINEFVARINGVNAHVFDWITHKMVEDHSVRLFSFPRQLMEAVRSTHELVVISGSPEFVVRPFVESFGIRHIYGSVYEQVNGTYTGVARSAGNKGELLRKMVDDGLVLQAGSVAIGDTVSDIPMLEFVDRPIMFNPSQTLATHGHALGWPQVNEVKDAISALTWQDEAKAYQLVDYRSLLDAD